jgi:hypothetical protein
MTTPSPAQLDSSLAAAASSAGFDGQPPGTVVTDFDRLLDRVAGSPTPLSANHLLPLKSLAEINEGLSHPLRLAMQRPQQKSFPPIHGLYLLLRASGLVRVEQRSGKPVLAASPEALRSWQALNPVERYFELLGAWWERATDEIIGERTGAFLLPVLRVLQFFGHLGRTGEYLVKTPQDADMLRHWPRMHHLALMELFGLVEITLAAEDKAWLPASIRLSGWGAGLLGHYRAVFDEAMQLDAGAESDDWCDPELHFQRWKNRVRPLFPLWRNGLTVPEKAIHSGSVRFKVSLGKDCWRRLAVPGEHSLDDLAGLILEAFRFDDEHGYAFRYTDALGRKVSAIDPPLSGETGESPADEVLLGELPLQPGYPIDFLYDFGESWRFVLETEAVDDTPIAKAKITEKHGKPPKQYSGW